MVQDYEIIQRCFRFRPDEIVKRIRISVVVALISESAFLKSQSNDVKGGDKMTFAKESSIYSDTNSSNPLDTGEMHADP